MPGLRPVLAAVMMVGWIGTAGAVCPGLDVLLEDGFEELAPTWGAQDGRFDVKDGRLLVSPASGTDYWRASNAGLLDEIDMCVTVTTLATIEASEAKAGAIFWYEDVNNFYVFQIAPNGQVSVWRRQRGRWLEQVPWRPVEEANEDDGGVNELRVTTGADGAVFYVNGSRVATLDATPPEDGGQVGLFAASPGAGRAIFAFDTLRITRP